VLRQQGEVVRAKQALQEAIRLRPEDPGPYSQLGQLLRTTGDFEGSAKYLAEAAVKKAAKESKQKEMFDRSSMARPKVIR